MSQFNIIKEEPKVVELKDGDKIFGKVEEITSRDVGASQANLARVTMMGPDFIHSHSKAEETYAYESGMGKIFLDGEVSDFGPGTRVVIPPGTLHAVKPAQSFPQVVFLCVSSPPFNPDDVEIDSRGRNW